MFAGLPETSALIVEATAVPLLFGAMLALGRTLKRRAGSWALARAVGTATGLSPRLARYRSSESSSAAMSAPMVSRVSSPMLDRRKVWPFSFP